MTTSAPQWPGQEGLQEPGSDLSNSPVGPVLRVVPRRSPRLPQPAPGPQPVPGPRPVPGPQSPPDRLPTSDQVGVPDQVVAPDQGLGPEQAGVSDQVLGPEQAGVPDQAVGPHPAVRPDQGLGPDRLVRPERPAPVEGPELRQRRRASMRGGRFVVVRDAAERDLWEKRRRARPGLPSPAAVTRDIALALLEVEAGCRSAAQLERIFSPELWEALEQRIGRRGGPLPSGRSLISVHCQEDRSGLADAVAVVHKGDLVRPVALRLDASGGRWRVTELRWWRNETDTTTTPGRDGRSSR